ncbi:MAG: HAD family hydrolase [Planctomycetota bacterium]
MESSNKIEFQAIIFDLDGTLLDTLTDIANSVNTVLAELGCPTHSVDAYRYFVGDGTHMLVQRVLPKDRRDTTDLNEFLQAVTDQYSKRWAETTKPYPGIPELLSALERRGLPKAILSNKPHDLTQMIVDKLLCDWSFSPVRGRVSSIPRKPDPAGALQIAKELGIPPQRFLYLGDTNTDMQTANAAGMFPVGALWGFRTADELLQNGAKTLVENPADLLPLLD